MGYKFHVYHFLEVFLTISESNLFHSVIVNGKSKFWKSVVLQRKVWKQPAYRCDLCRGGINSYKEGGNFAEIILYKYDIRLNRLLSFKNSSPNSWYKFSFEVSLIAPVIANAVLYWLYWTVPRSGDEVWQMIYILSTSLYNKFIFLITLTHLVAFLIVSFVWSKKLSLESRNQLTCFWMFSLTTGTLLK